MDKKEFLNYIIDFAIHTGWEDWNGKDQIRALFTSWCLIFHVDTDTVGREQSLCTLYYKAKLDELVEYEEYRRFMIEFIV